MPLASAGVISELANRYGPGIVENVREMARRGTKRFLSTRNSQNLRRSKRQRSARRINVGGRGITQQHDVARIYRKKYMTKYKKRRWRKFVRRVHAVAEKDYGSRTVVFNDRLDIENITNGNQVCLTCCLYPQTSTVNHLNDLNTIASVENFENNPTSAAGITVEKSTKFLFQSGVLDLTVRNSSFNNTTPTSGVKMEVDVYELILRKDAIVGATAQGSLSTLLNNASADTKVLNATGSSVEIIRRGCTPWDLPYCISRYGLKILSKKKYFLESGGTFTYQVRDPARHVLDQNDMNDRQGFNRPKLTRIVYFIGKLVPGFTLGATGDTYRERLDVGVTRKYLYKIEGANDDRDVYEANAATITNPF